MLRTAGAWRARPPGSYCCSRGHQICLRPRAAVPEDAVHRADAGDRVRVANPLRQELVPDLPREHARVLLLEAQNLLHNRGRGHMLQ